MENAQFSNPTKVTKDRSCVALGRASLSTIFDLWKIKDH